MHVLWCAPDSEFLMLNHKLQWALIALALEPFEGAPEV